jgi:hypothetical protein
MLVRSGENLKDSRLPAGFLVLVAPEIPAVLRHSYPKIATALQHLMPMVLVVDFAAAHFELGIFASASIDEQNDRICARFATLFAAEANGHL